jgi:hypothetical protein
LVSRVADATFSVAVGWRIGIRPESDQVLAVDDVRAECCADCAERDWCRETCAEHTLRSGTIVREVFDRMVSDPADPAEIAH